MAPTLQCRQAAFLAWLSLAGARDDLAVSVCSDLRCALARPDAGRQRPDSNLILGTATWGRPVSAFGPAGIIAYADATRRDRQSRSETELAAPSHGAALPASAGLSEKGRVVRWIAERTEPAGDPAAITIDDLHADYEVWCLTNGLQALSRDDFAAQFDHVRDVPELAGKIRKFGNRYYGIHLLELARSPRRR
jgi:hypothetical protein